MMDMTTDIRKLLLVGSSSGEIRVKAREQGMRSLAEMVGGWLPKGRQRPMRFFEFRR